MLALVFQAAPAAQDRTPAWLATIPAPDVGRLPGCWTYVTEFHIRALPGEVFDAALADVRKERDRVPQELLAAHIDLENYLQAYVNEGGQKKWHTTQEYVAWIPAHGDVFSEKVTSIGPRALDENGYFVLQVLVEEDYVVMRNDAGSTSMYHLYDRTPKHRVENLYLHGQVREHASVVRYFIKHGHRDQGGYRLHPEIVATVRPAGFQMPVTARRGFLRVTVAGPTVRLIASLFDYAGRPVLEWHSLWNHSQGCRSLERRTFVAGSGELSDTASLRVKLHQPETPPPDAVSIAFTPTELHEGYDERSNSPAHVFDPTKGIPAPLPPGSVRSPAPYEAPSEQDEVSGPTPGQPPFPRVVEGAPEWVPERLAHDATVANRPPIVPKEPADWPTYMMVGVSAACVIALIVARRQRASMLLFFAALSGATPSCNDESRAISFQPLRDQDAMIPDAMIPDDGVGTVELAPTSIHATLSDGEFQRRRVYLINNTSADRQRLPRPRPHRPTDCAT
ncbi:MAG TPA: hypothetical protein ENI87_15560 [bacterium]|nr:hypothetical protein [bacterium]